MQSQPTTTTPRYAVALKPGDELALGPPGACAMVEGVRPDGAGEGILVVNVELYCRASDLLDVVVDQSYYLASERAAARPLPTPQPTPSANGQRRSPSILARLRRAR